MWRRPVFYAIGLLTPALFVVELTVLGGTGLANTRGYPDPFAPYEAIMPGQPTTALEHYPCQFERVYAMETEPTVCRLRLNERIFDEVIVQFYGDKIWQVVFKPEGLHFGELVQRWGFPDIDAIYPHSVYMHWGETVYATISPIDTRRRSSYLLPVYDPIVVEMR